MEFDSEYVYINSATNNLDKIAKIDLVIEGLLDVAIKAATTENISEYSIDSGQSKIKAVYKGTESVYKSITAFRRLRQEFVNNLNGRIFRAVDSKSFNGRRY